MLVCIGMLAAEYETEVYGNVDAIRFFSSVAHENGTEMDDVGDCDACAQFCSMKEAFEDARVRTMPAPYGGVA
jgi:hypothetical protein